MEDKEVTKNQLITVGLILFFALILRLYLAQFGGYEHDIKDFTNWSNEVTTNGFVNFYENTGSDYPPFYIYILWWVGHINNLISSDINLLLKFPAIIADIFAAFFIFLVVRIYTTYKIALTSMIFYAFNPAIIFTSSIWGQVDSIYTLFLVLAIGCFIIDSPKSSVILFTLAVLTKPQSLVLLPLLAVLFYKKYSYQMFITFSLLSLIIFMVVSKPFYLFTSSWNIFNLYLSSYTQYQFTSMNAFNLWALMGMFKPDDTIFLLFSYRIWGYILFGISLLWIIYILLKKNDNRMIYGASALLFFGFFILSTRMHERYLFPMFAFLAIAMIFDKRLKLLYIITSLTFFINLYIVYTEVNTGVAIPLSMFLIPYMIGINIVMFIYFVHYFCTHKQIKS